MIETNLQIVPPTPETIQEYTECIVCKAPLGAESRDLDYRVCLEHRKCDTCGLVLQPNEIRLCHTLAIKSDDSIEVKHARCASKHPSIDLDPTCTIKQSYFDWLNNIRLMVEPNMELAVSTNEYNAGIYHSRFIAKMTHDEIFAHIGMLEYCVMNARMAVSKDKELLQKRADEREKLKGVRALKEAHTSSRPVGKPPEDLLEVSLADFMSNFRITSRKVGMKLQKDRDRSAASLAKIGVPSSAAKETADKMLRDNISKGIVKVTE